MRAAREQATAAELLRADLETRRASLEQASAVTARSEERVREREKRVAELEEALARRDAALASAEARVAALTQRLEAQLAPDAPPGRLRTNTVNHPSPGHRLSMDTHPGPGAPHIGRRASPGPGPQALPLPRQATPPRGSNPIAAEAGAAQSLVPQQLQGILVSIQRGGDRLTRLQGILQSMGPAAPAAVRSLQQCLEAMRERAAGLRSGSPGSGEGVRALGADYAEWEQELGRKLEEFVTAQRTAITLGGA
uniref:Uncharacterized protein n=2 Tax=Auxenochlorella protothecoides TaxID=3075 RepID=A0A1D1ZNJ5_AUXPR